MVNPFKTLVGGILILNLGLAVAWAEPPAPGVESTPAKTLTDQTVEPIALQAPEPQIQLVTLQAETPEPLTGVEHPEVAKKESPFHLELTTYRGYRPDKFSWNIRDSSGSPNPLSELTWSPIRYLQYQGKARLIWHDRWYLRGNYTFANLFNGTAQDSDYGGNNRTGEFSRSYSQVRGQSNQSSLGLGYQFHLKREEPNRIIFAPVVGYAYDLQHLQQRNLRQTIDSFGSTIIQGNDLFDIPGKVSTFRTQWQGPWVGADLSYQITKRLKLFHTLEYHHYNYTGIGDWLLRPDFAHPNSFADHARGQGITTEVGASYQLSKRLFLNASMGYQRRSTGSGRDTTFFSDKTFGTDPLNKAYWRSWAFNLGLMIRI